MSEVKKIATREAFGETLVELGKKHPELVVLDADLAAATKTAVFKKSFPDRHFDCGIAEANMMGVAAGLSLVGKNSGGELLCHVCNRPCLRTDP